MNAKYWFTVTYETTPYIMLAQVAEPECHQIVGKELYISDCRSLFPDWTLLKWTCFNLRRWILFEPPPALPRLAPTTRRLLQVVWIFVQKLFTLRCLRSFKRFASGWGRPQSVTFCLQVLQQHFCCPSCNSSHITLEWRRGHHNRLHHLPRAGFRSTQLLWQEVHSIYFIIEVCNACRNEVQKSTCFKRTTDATLSATLSEAGLPWASTYRGSTFQDPSNCFMKPSLASLYVICEVTNVLSRFASISSRPHHDSCKLKYEANSHIASLKKQLFTPLKGSASSSSR